MTVRSLALGLILISGCSWGPPGGCAVNPGNEKTYQAWMDRCMFNYGLGETCNRRAIKGGLVRCVEMPE